VLHRPNANHVEEGGFLFPAFARTNISVAQKKSRAVVQHGIGD
jgi:hypothetical protein